MLNEDRETDRHDKAERSVLQFLGASLTTQGNYSKPNIFKCAIRVKATSRPEVVLAFNTFWGWNFVVFRRLLACCVDNFPCHKQPEWQHVTLQDTVCTSACARRIRNCKTTRDILLMHKPKRHCITMILYWLYKIISPKIQVSVSINISHISR